MTSGAILILLFVCLLLFVVWTVRVIRPALMAAQNDKKHRRIIPSDDMLDYARQAVLREDYELALDLCDQIFEQPQAYEHYPEALDLRIELLTRLQRYDEALADMHRLKHLTPDNLEAFAHLIDLPDSVPAAFVNEARKILAGLEK